MDLTATLESIPAETKHEPSDKPAPDVPRIKAVLDQLDPSRADNYDTWSKVGYALKSESEDYFGHFDEWSKKSAKYGGTRPFWDSIKRKEGGITIASLFYWAREDQKLREPKDKLTPINAVAMPEMFREDSEPLVHGLLDIGDVWNIVGGPKTNKTQFAIQLAVSIAAGVPFLGFPTEQGRVLVIDNEVKPRKYWRRLRDVIEAMGLDWDKVARNIDVLPMRGRLSPLHDIADMLQSRAGQYKLCVVDSLYKALQGTVDENSNAEVAAVYCTLDNTAEKSQSAIGIVHHTSKGSQANKSVSDIGSGAGAQSRSADVHTVLLPHEDEGYFVLSTIARSQKPIKPMVLKFDWPLWSVAPDKAPTVAAPNKKSEPTIEEFLATMPIEAAPKVEVLKHSKLKLLCSARTVNRLYFQCITDGTIEQISPANRREKHKVRRIEKRAA